MASPVRPADRSHFHVAIICALPREFDAVQLLLDHEDEENEYGRAVGDTNMYTTGSIGKHDVVLVCLPNMGITSAASAAASLRSSFSGIKLALVVGICGGVPTIHGYPVMLGDVVISKTVIQYDYGRQLPGSFQVRNEIEDTLGRASKELRNLISTFETRRGRERLQTKAAANLKRLQEIPQQPRGPSYQYPGRSLDKLFQSGYTHAHRPPHRSCDSCARGPDSFCASASEDSCVDAGCDEANLVSRERSSREVGYLPEIFVGRVGSGNAVMKSGEHRDRIAKKHRIIAFEMEGAGTWDEFPCLVVKGICDYADSHKNKEWQDFAAATAASVAKAILERFIVNDDQPRMPEGGSKGAVHENGVQGNGNRIISGNNFGGNAQVIQGDMNGISPPGWRH